MALLSGTRWSQMTPMLFFSCFSLLVGDMLFGYDTASFGGVLANPGFVNQFGDMNSAGKYSISSLRTSLLSSLAFIGKLIGCLGAGPLIEKLGHRKVFGVLSIISCMGIIIEITAAGDSNGSGRIPQFIVGRILVYIAVGLVEVAVTTYQSEIVPASLRGLVVMSLQVFLNSGSVVATGVNKAFSTHTSPKGWKSVTGIQFIFSVFISVFAIFIPDSPRWLLSKDRYEDAIKSMRRLRTKEDVQQGYCEEEVAAIQEALSANIYKAPWIRLVLGNNLRRTSIVLVNYSFQQITGQAFVSTYQTVFYKTNGFADNAFTYPVISSCLTIVSVIVGMQMIDNLGRRTALMISTTFQALWLFILAGLGSENSGNSSVKNTVVASFMLYAFSYNLGGASIPYVLGAEIPQGALREKTSSIGTGLNVFWAWLTNFVIPYMLDAIHFKVGWIFGTISLLATFYVFFFLPETKGRALEEIDEIFDQPFNPFKPPGVSDSGAAHRVAELETYHQRSTHAQGDAKIAPEAFKEPVV